MSSTLLKIHLYSLKKYSAMFSSMVQVDDKMAHAEFMFAKYDSILIT